MIQVEPITGGVGIENVDFVVYDAGVSEVIRAEGTFGNSTESISMTSFATGTYYVKVFAPDGDTGEYNLS